ncbi:MAG: hypothetical protein M0Z45_01335 [Actinomycetota bacterium]|nr:hypothetical protein [Actinomycetota bacterium]
MIDVKVLHTVDCPNLEPLLDLIDQLSDQFQLEVEVKLIATEEEGRENDFHGSPTVLLNGIDPFTSSESEFGLSCRIYLDQSSGERVGFPTKDMLHLALQAL